MPYGKAMTVTRHTVDARNNKIPLNQMAPNKLQSVHIKPRIFRLDLYSLISAAM